MRNDGLSPAVGADALVRWAVTAGAVIALWVGYHIPLPGLDPEAGLRVASDVQRSRLSIFALGVLPIVSASALVELARLAIPPFARWAAASARNGERLNRSARSLALALAAFQAVAIAALLEGVAGLVAEPGWLFRLGVVASLVGSTAFLAWLADFVTRRGVGDGLLILFAAPFIARLPFEIAMWFQLGRSGVLPPYAPNALLLALVGAVALLAAASRASKERRALDVWPTLLATVVFQLILTFTLPIQSALGLGSRPSPAMHDPAARMMLAAVFVIVLVLLQGALIAGFALARASAGGPRVDRGATLAQSVVCGGGLVLALVFSLATTTSGCWLILCVAAVESCVSPRSMPGGGFSNFAALPPTKVPAGG